MDILLLMMYIHVVDDILYVSQLFWSSPSSYDLRQQLVLFDYAQEVIADKHFHMKIYLNTELNKGHAKI